MILRHRVFEAIRLSIVFPAYHKRATLTGGPFSRCFAVLLTEHIYLTPWYLRTLKENSALPVSS